jgi:hypothetical protein
LVSANVEEAISFVQGSLPTPIASGISVTPTVGEFNVVSEPIALSASGMNQVEAQFCREFTQDLLNCPLCYAFAVPIDPHADWAPDYFRIISRPMDLSTVMKNLKSRQYSLLSDWCRDINLIWQNAMTFNKKPSLLFFVADFLQKKCERKFARTPHSSADWTMIRLEKAHRQLSKVLSFDLSHYSIIPRVPPDEMKYVMK